MTRLSGDPPEPRLPPEPLTGEEMVAAQDWRRARRWWLVWRLLCLGLLAFAVAYPAASGMDAPLAYYLMLCLAWTLLAAE